MKHTKLNPNRLFCCLLLLLLLAQLGVNAWFGSQKQGFHYDEYYSYYSSNVTYRLLPTDREWKDADEIRSEFAVLPGGRFQYPMVVLMQTFDVHPPVYYLLLHTVCSFFPGVFTKWTGIGLNLFFFVLCYLLLAWLAWRLSGGRQELTFLTCLLFGLNPGIISGVTFIRMYLLLTVFLFLLTCLHTAAIRRGKLTFFRFYLPLMATVYLGFLTHYYFFVYLFMLAAAFAFWQFFCGGCVPVNPAKKRKSFYGLRFRYVCQYGLTIGAALALAVLSYPACLSHIFRGYRGTGAASAFFDPKNTGKRISFFLNLLNNYVFGGVLPVLLLFLLLLLVTAGYLKKRNGRVNTGLQNASAREDKTIIRTGFLRPALGILAFAVTGYFLVVSKTALMTAEEANRYEQPVYGLILLLVLFLVYGIAAACLPRETGTPSSASAVIPAPSASARSTEDGRLRHTPEPVLSGSSAGASAARFRLPAVLTGLAAALLLAAQLTGLVSGKVLFLYPEDTQNYAFADVHKDDAVLYYYNNDLQWMIWDDSMELMRYDELYFVNLADPSAVTDRTVNEAPSLIVYAMRTDNTRTALANLLTGNPAWSSCEKIGERLYCDIYEIS